MALLAVLDSANVSGLCDLVVMYPAASSSLVYFLAVTVLTCRWRAISWIDFLEVLLLIFWISVLIL